MSGIFDDRNHGNHRDRTFRRKSGEERIAGLGIERLTISPRPEGHNTSPAATDPETGAWIIAAEGESGGVPDKDSFAMQARITLDRKARVMPNIADHVIVEYYRRVRTKLIHQHAAAPFRSVLVTSPNPQEGKSVTTLNLALSFSMLPSFKVLVIDADLRRGTIGNWLGLNNKPGFSNLLDGSASLADVVFRCEESPVHFIVRGTSQTPAAELLSSADLSAQIRNITERFELVLIDSPPVHLITDTHILAARCDAVLMVARAFSTTCQSFEKAVQELSARRILGAVLNGGARSHSYRRYDGYY